MNTETHGEPYAEDRHLVAGPPLPSQNYSKTGVLGIQESGEYQEREGILSKVNRASDRQQLRRWYFLAWPPFSAML